MRSFIVFLRPVGVFGAVLLFGLMFARSGQAGFVDPLDASSLMVPEPAEAPMISLTKAGDHLVAVGSRGVIITSNPDGSWTQASVPIQSDLTDVQFIDANNGWACGHDGSVLHTTDGGKTWVKLFDGRMARTSFEAYYNQKIGTASNSPLTPFLQQVQLNYDNGPTLPWLSVWFNSPQVGFVVGSFGDIAATTDGGKTWQPWFENIDNSTFLDLNAVANIGGQTYIVGEQGEVYFLDTTQNNGQGKFVLRSTGYSGSLFGLLGDARAVIVYGMRGQIYRSTDQGKTWTDIKDPLQSSLMSGEILPDGSIMLVNVDGGIVVSHDDGLTFTTGPTQNMPLTGIAAMDASKIAVSGLGGVQYISGN